VDIAVEDTPHLIGVPRRDTDNDFGDPERRVVLELALVGNRPERDDVQGTGIPPGGLEGPPQLGQ
jgi:hypothetical protein